MKVEAVQLASGDEIPLVSVRGKGTKCRLIESHPAFKKHSANTLVLVGDWLYQLLPTSSPASCSPLHLNSSSPLATCLRKVIHHLLWTHPTSHPFLSLQSPPCQLYYQGPSEDGAEEDKGEESHRPWCSQLLFNTIQPFSLWRAMRESGMAQHVALGPGATTCSLCVRTNGRPSPLSIPVHLLHFSTTPPTSDTYRSSLIQVYRGVIKDW